MNFPNWRVIKSLYQNFLMNGLDKYLPKVSQTAVSHLVSHRWRAVSTTLGVTCEDLRWWSGRKAQVPTCPKGRGGIEAPGQLRHSSWAGQVDGSLLSCTTTRDYLLFKTKAALNPTLFVALTTICCLSFSEKIVYSHSSRHQVVTFNFLVP